MKNSSLNELEALVKLIFKGAELTRPEIRSLISKGQFGRDGMPFLVETVEKAVLRGETVPPTLDFIYQTWKANAITTNAPLH